MPENLAMTRQEWFDALCYAGSSFESMKERCEEHQTGYRMVFIADCYKHNIEWFPVNADALRRLLDYVEQVVADAKQ